jgi:hypothetical protein
MYVPPGNKDPFYVEHALKFNEWKQPVKNYHLKCKCSTFYVPKLDDYYNFEADYIISDSDIEKIKFNIDGEEFELIIEKEDWDSIEKFYIDSIDKQQFIDECVSMIKKYDGIWFGTGSEEYRTMNSYYDIFLDILFDDFPFDKYNLNAFCSDFWGHFGSYYKNIGIRKANIEKGIISGPRKLEFPLNEFKPL